MEDQKLDAASLRGAIAARCLLLYKIGAVVDCHPGVLGQILRGKKPLPEGLAARIAQALESEDVGSRA